MQALPLNLSQFPPKIDAEALTSHYPAALLIESLARPVKATNQPVCGFAVFAFEAAPTAATK